MNMKKRVILHNLGVAVSVDKDGLGLQGYDGGRWVSLQSDQSHEFVGEYIDDSSLYSGIMAGLSAQGISTVEVFLKQYDPNPPVTA